MTIMRLLSIACCTVLLQGATVTRAQAQETTEMQAQDDIVSLAERPQRARWDASLATSWLPASNIHGTGGDLSAEEVRFRLERRFQLDARMELSAGLNYSDETLDAPDSARLPDSLRSVAVSMGVDYRTTDRLTLGGRISPGLSSDFKAVSGRDVRVPVAFHAQYRASAELTYLGGLAYTGGNRTLPVMPMLGVLYTPSERWTFALGMPRTGVIYRPYRGMELHLGAESGRGEYHLHDASLGSDVISYRDYRGVAGVETALCSFLKLGIAGGYAFDRKFVFYDGNRADVSLDNAPFAKVEVKAAW